MHWQRGRRDRRHHRRLQWRAWDRSRRSFQPATRPEDHLLNVTQTLNSKGSPTELGGLFVLALAVKERSFASRWSVRTGILFGLHERSLSVSKSALAPADL